MRSKIFNIVINAIHSINPLLEVKIPTEKGYECELYGASGVIDSLSLVSLIVAIEEGIENEFNVSVILADEKAMSQKRSPFSSVRTLVDYIQSLMSKEVANA